MSSGGPPRSAQGSRHQSGFLPAGGPQIQTACGGSGPAAFIGRQGGHRGRGGRRTWVGRGFCGAETGELRFTSRGRREPDPARHRHHMPGPGIASKRLPSSRQGRHRPGPSVRPRAAGGPRESDGAGLGPWLRGHRAVSFPHPGSSGASFLGLSPPPAPFHPLPINTGPSSKRRCTLRELDRPLCACAPEENGRRGFSLSEGEAIELSGKSDLLVAFSWFCGHF